MFTQLRKTYYEFPSNFWVIVLARFIDGLGNTLLFPFFALYITQKFDVGMTQAGVMLGASSLAGLFGNIFGGALADKFGRRSIILFGLVFSAVSSIALGLTNELSMMFALSIFVGLIGSIGHPAHGAMVADILPEEKRQEGFGILRVVGNMSWLVGPTIGGFVASRSYLALFISDAVISCIVALIVYRYLPESKPAPHPDEEHQSLMQTVGGYGIVIRDFAFMAFITASILMTVVYQQMYNSLSVFLRDNHGIDPQGYGFLLSTSAITVILFQFWTTRRIKRYPPFLMMGAGAIFYAIGFSLFGFVATLALFAMNIVIITIGEMFIMPVSQALVAGFAPEEMRGRYMAVSGLTWLVPSTFGPGLAGYLLDNYNPNLLWYIGGILCLIAAIGFYALHIRLGARPQFAPTPKEGTSLPAATD
ncbi:MAG TPA: MFS transporter [Anaerolineales bacterium]|nr:MFS transporter [Anaerolineales bacterium]